MASNGKRSSGDLVLESKHLVGLFLLLVVIFGVVFTLGYIMGRSQNDAKLRAAAGKPSDSNVSDAASSPMPKDNSDTAENLPSQKNSDWDFYHSGEPKKTEDHLQPPPKPVAAGKLLPAAKPSAAAAKPAKSAAKQPKAPVPVNGPLIPNGAIMLQVAAVQSQGDALALAQALQQKKFPAFVITPKTDKYYRVQVGPYKDTQAATNARKDLEAKGFKSIVKR